MKTITNNLTLTVLATLIFCTQAHAMWRTAGQKLSCAAYTALQARTELTGKLSQTAGKALQGTALQRGLVMASRMKPASMPELRPATTRLYSAAAQATGKTVPSHKVQATLRIAKLITAGATAIGTGLGAAYGIKKPSEDLAINKFDINNLDHCSAEFINTHYCKIVERYKNNPTAFNALTNFVAKNFTKILSAVILDLLKKNPSGAETFIDPLIQNLTTTDPDVVLNIIITATGFLYSNHDDYKTAEFLLRTLKKCAEQVSKHYFMLHKKTIDITVWSIGITLFVIYRAHFGEKKFIDIANNANTTIDNFNAFIKKQVIPEALQHFTIIDPDKLAYIVDLSDPDDTKKFTELAIQHFATTKPVILITLTTKDPTAAKKFAPLACNTILI